MEYKRLIPVIIPLIIWVIGQIFLRWTSLFYCALATGALVIVLGVRLLAGKGKHDWPFMAIAPVIFFLVFSCYVAILIGNFWIQALLILVAWFLFNYFRNLYYYLTHKELEIIYENKLDNLLIASSFLTVFAAATTLFSLPEFINWPIWATILIIAAIIFLLFVQFKALKKIKSGSAQVLAFIGVLCLAELTWGLSLLPLKFHLLGLFLAIAYYLILFIIRLHLRGALNRQVLRVPLILSAVAFIVLFLTARWL
jgi:hypothetical protein